MLRMNFIVSLMRRLRMMLSFRKMGYVNVEEEKQSDDAETKTLVAGDTVMKQGAPKVVV